MTYTRNLLPFHEHHYHYKQHWIIGLFLDFSPTAGGLINMRDFVSNFSTIEMATNNNRSVVWNINYIFPIDWVSNHPNWLSYFSEGWPNHQPDGDFMWFSRANKRVWTCLNQPKSDRMCISPAYTCVNWGVQKQISAADRCGFTTEKVVKHH